MLLFDQDKVFWCFVALWCIVVLLFDQTIVFWCSVRTIWCIVCSEQFITHHIECCNCILSSVQWMPFSNECGWKARCAPLSPLLPSGFYASNSCTITARSIYLPGNSLKVCRLIFVDESFPHAKCQYCIVACFLCLNQQHCLVVLHCCILRLATSCHDLTVATCSEVTPVVSCRFGDPQIFHSRWVESIRVAIFSLTHWWHR